MQYPKDTCDCKDETTIKAKCCFHCQFCDLRIKNELQHMHEYFLHSIENNDLVGLEFRRTYSLINKKK